MNSGLLTARAIRCAAKLSRISSPHYESALTAGPESKCLNPNSQVPNGMGEQVTPRARPQGSLDVTPRNATRCHVTPPDVTRCHSTMEKQGTHLDKSEGCSCARLLFERRARELSCRQAGDRHLHWPAEPEDDKGTLIKACCTLARNTARPCHVPDARIAKTASPD